MDPLVIAVTVVATVLCVVLVVVGVQLILVLQELKQTLRRVNALSSSLEHAAAHFFTPLAQMGGMVTGMKAGLKMLETFVGFLQKNNDAGNDKKSA